MTKILSRLFGVPEEINGRHRCPTYLYRWTLLKAGKLFSIYLHHFVNDDWSLDLHDHPKRFISVGLRGGYIEWTPCTTCAIPCGFENQKVFNAPWIRSFPADHIHRLAMFRSSPSGKPQDCWTLVIVLKATRQWGFWNEGRFIPWRSYVDGKDSSVADRRTTCG